MKNFQHLVSYSFIGLMLLLNVGFFNMLPDQLPIHWNSNGVAVGFGAKLLVMAIAPGLAFFLTILFASLSHFNKEMFSPDGRGNTYLMGGITFLLLSIHAGILLVAMHPKSYGIKPFVMLGFGVLNICIGMALPGIRPNAWVGIRTPWTVTSRGTWDATHRIAAKAFIVSGILSLLVMRYSMGLHVAMMLTLSAGIGSAGYSYFYSRKHLKN